MRGALLVVDMTNDYFPKNYDVSLENGRGEDLIPRIRKLEDPSWTASGRSLLQRQAPQDRL